MTMHDETGRHDADLGDAYGAQTSAELAAVYDRWSDSYDEYMDGVGYRHPAICVALLARHVPLGNVRVLDAGVGTGIVGELLAIVGYAAIDGIDISQGMLDKAAEKGLYADLRVADMTQPLDLISDHYGAVISSGVFTTGHVGSEGVGQLLAVCETGGHLVITVKVGVWQDDIQPFLHALVRDGKVRIVDQTEPYLSMPGDPNTIPSLAIVIKKL